MTMNRNGKGRDMAKRASGLGGQLGRWVASRRENLGLTQQTGRIQNLPDFDQINALSEALRVPVTEVLRGAGVLPEGVDQAPEIAPGSTTMHALIDMIDWTRDQTSREDVEGLLRVILDRQKRR
jgi:hypothetical protein